MNVATEVRPVCRQENIHLNVRKKIIRATAFLALWIASFPFIFPAIMVAAAFTVLNIWISR